MTARMTPIKYTMATLTIRIGGIYSNKLIGFCWLAITQQHDALILPGGFRGVQQGTGCMKAKLRKGAAVVIILRDGIDLLLQLRSVPVGIKARVRLLQIVTTSAMRVVLSSVSSVSTKAFAAAFVFAMRLLSYMLFELSMTSTTSEVVL